MDLDDELASPAATGLTTPVAPSPGDDPAFSPEANSKEPPRHRERDEKDEAKKQMTSNKSSSALPPPVRPGAVAVEGNNNFDNSSADNLYFSAVSTRQFRLPSEPTIEPVTNPPSLLSSSCSTPPVEVNRSAAKRVHRRSKEANKQNHGPIDDIERNNSATVPAETPGAFAVHGSSDATSAAGPVLVMNNDTTGSIPSEKQRVVSSRKSPRRGGDDPSRKPPPPTRSPGAVAVYGRHDEASSLDIESPTNHNAPASILGEKHRLTVRNKSKQEEAEESNSDESKPPSTDTTSPIAAASDQPTGPPEPAEPSPLMEEKKAIAYRPRRKNRKAEEALAASVKSIQNLMTDRSSKVLAVEDASGALDTVVPDDTVKHHAETPTAKILTDGDLEDEYRGRILNQVIVDGTAEVFDEEAPKRERRRYQVLLAIAAVVAIAGIVIGAVLGTRPKAKETLAPSMMPSMMPSSTHENLYQEVALYPDAALDVDSPQFLSLEWLLNDTGLGGFTTGRRRLRYALGTMFFGLNQTIRQEFSKLTKWGTYAHECEWTFFDCSNDGMTLLGFTAIYEETAVEADDVLWELYDYFLSLYMPPEIGLLSNFLQWVDVGFYPLLDRPQQSSAGLVPDLAPMPSELGLLTNLQTLTLWGTLLTDTIPSQIGQLSELTSLHLPDNKFLGQLPESFESLTKLESLQLAHSFNLGFEIPPVIGTFTNLRNVDFSYNFITGGIPTEFYLLTSVKYLDLTSTHLDGTISTEIGSFSDLQALSISNTELEIDEGLPLEKLTALQHLELDHAIFAYLDLPDDIGLLLKNLTHLSMFRSNAAGTLPTSMGLLKHLTHLDLSWGSLDGTIPTEIASLTALEHLYLSANFLTGPIPSEIGTMSNLLVLGLGGNDFSGDFPSELGNLGGTLEGLYVGANSGIIDSTLQGTIPCDALEGTEIIAPCDLVSCSCCAVCCYNSNQNVSICPTCGSYCLEPPQIEVTNWGEPIASDWKFGYLGA